MFLKEYIIKSKSEKVIQINPINNILNNTNNTNNTNNNLLKTINKKDTKNNNTNNIAVNNIHKVQNITNFTNNIILNNPNNPNNPNKNIKPTNNHNNLTNIPSNNPIFKKAKSCDKNYSSNNTILDNNKFTALYCPRIHDFKHIKKYENLKGVNWYDLSPKSRIKVNEEISSMLDKKLI